MAQEDVFKKLVSHCKEYGFVFPSSEIYDGLGAVYDYGQYGVELKNNIKKYWWDSISGPLIAELTIPSTGGWECWKTLQTDIVKPVTGIQDIYFVFKGRKGCKLFNFDWYKFNR